MRTKKTGITGRMVVTTKDGPTGDSDISNRAYLLNELAESRMR